MGSAINIGKPLIINAAQEIQKQKQRKKNINKVSVIIAYGLALDILASTAFAISATLNTLWNDQLDTGLILFPTIWIVSASLLFCLCDSHSPTERHPGCILFSFFVWTLPHILLTCYYLLAMATAVVVHTNGETVTLREFCLLTMAIMYGCFTYFGASALLEYRQTLSEYQELDQLKEQLNPATRIADLMQSTSTNETNLDETLRFSALVHRGRI